MIDWRKYLQHTTKKIKGHSTRRASTNGQKKSHATQKIKRLLLKKVNQQTMRGGNTVGQ